MHGKCGLFFTSYRSEAQFFASRFQKICLVLFLLAVAFGPLGLRSYHLSVLTFINISVIGAVSLNLLTGYCGQISLGHGAFVGVGAYATAWFARHGVPFFPALLGGGAVSAMVGMVFGLPSLRLKGIYLAIATLAAQLILEYVFLHWDSATGGLHGVPVASPEIFGFAFDNDRRMFYLTFVFAAIVTYAASNLMRSKSGRAFVAIRDFYLSAEIVGVNLFAYKLQAFGVSSFMAGLAGGLWAFYTMFITPEPFGIGLSISYLSMIIIGGLGSIIGAIFGAVFLTVLPEVLNIIAQWGGSYFPNISSSFLAMKGGIFGLVLVLFLIFEPEGLAHRWRLAKAYWKLYPFAH